MSPHKVSPQTITVTVIQPSPFDNPQNWDSVTIAGLTWGSNAPGAGRIVVKRAKRSYKWEKKNPKGQVGERQTWVGRNFPPFELHFHFWDTPGFDYWQDYSKVFVYGDGTEPPVLSIYHPSLVLVGISQVIIVDVGAAELQNEGGEYIATVTLEEFKPVTAKNITASPAGASNTTNTNGKASITGVAIPPRRAALQAAIAIEQARVAGANGGIFDPLLGWIPLEGGFP